MQTEETTVQSTSQEGEQTQQDVNQSLESSANENGETQEAQGTTEAKEEGKDPNGWALKRIGELTRQRHEAERKAETATSEAARYRALMEQMKADPGAEIDQQQRQPQQQQPQDIDALVEARATQKAQQDQIQARGKSVATTGEAAYPDWASAVQNLDALGISDSQVSALLGMDDAEKVIYSLGKNPEEAARILSLPPVEQGRALERLALKAAQPAAKAVSNAPAPITPVDSNVSGDIDPSKLSMEEWVKWRNKNATTRF